jgi:hypothetical protein
MNANIKIISDLKNFIAEISTNADLRSYFTNSPSDFSRERKLGFERSVLLLLNFFKKSYSIELEEFYCNFSPGEHAVSKSAFCQQRGKLKSLFFDCLNELLVQSFYQHYNKSAKLWKGFRLIAVDGSTVYLTGNKDITDYFGTHKGSGQSVPMGQVLSAFDVLNGITVRAGLYPVKTAEQKIAQCWLDSYTPDMLLLYDRGYPGFTSIFVHQNKEQPQPFLMRCRLGLNEAVKAFVSSGATDACVLFKAGKVSSEELYRQGYIVPIGQGIKVRLVRVVLDNGQTEVLATNLFDVQIYPPDIFKELYFKRWGIETNYNTLKNQLQMEAFSGQRVTTVMQDFQINFFLANLQQIIGKDGDKALIKRARSGKYAEYRINRNTAFGLMKNRIITLFTGHEPEIILNTLIGLFIRYLEPVRPGRRYPHSKKPMRASGKYQPVTNYKRCI